MTWRCRYGPTSLGMTYPYNYGMLVSPQSYPFWVWDARCWFWVLVSVLVLIITQLLFYVHTTCALLSHD
ncbi:hypothetical protein HanRHA438_Chr09g0380911 [Helianthus annuus]|nr:hypothetical protein HanRHA438_Chr09g0380911 [Helianthus annuus]